MQKYPLFIPPGYLATKYPKQWNAKEARAYKDWLLGIIDERISNLLRILGFDEDFATKDHLLDIGEKATNLLQSEQFAEEGPRGKSLNNQGRALAADLGLLVAQILIKENNGRIYWEILKKPKSELSYNLPVLKGFLNNYLDPVGGSTAEAAAILRGQREADCWIKIYNYWNSNV